MRFNVVLLLLSSCTVDSPVCFTPPGRTAPALRLSELGLFNDLAGMAPAPGVIPYEVAVPLYSDGAAKQRYFSLPANTQFLYSGDRWTIPLGARFVKTFMSPDKSVRIETRLLENTRDGFVEGTYRWTADQTDALCSGGNEDVPLPDAGLTFHVPGTSRCETCHEAGSLGHALGLRTRQMNTGTQIDDLLARRLLDQAPAASERAQLPDPFGTALLGDRAQAYLDVNCGNCHFEHGFAAGTGVFFDLGNATGNFCRKTGTVSGRNVVIAPGASDRSELIARMQSNDPFVRMPQGPNHVPDARGIALLEEWIDSLPLEECPP
jgi:hypothetical protein